MPKLTTSRRRGSDTRNITATSFRVDENHGAFFTLVIFAKTPTGRFVKVNTRIDFDKLPEFMPRIGEYWRNERLRRLDRCARIDASVPAPKLT